MNRIPTVLALLMLTSPVALDARPAVAEIRL